MVVEDPLAQVLLARMFFGVHTIFTVNMSDEANNAVDLLLVRCEKQRFLRGVA